MEPLGENSSNCYIFLSHRYAQSVELVDDVAVVEGSDCEASTVRLGQTGM